MQQVYSDFIAHFLTSTPWLVRVSIGHLLPLMLSVWFLWQRRTSLTSVWFLPFAFGVTAGSQIMLKTLKASVQYGPDHSFHGAMVQMPINYLIWGAVLVSFVFAAMGKKPDYKMLFAGVFLPAYVIDWYVSVFIGVPFDILPKAIGGAGPLDALILAPTLAVLCSWVAVLEVKTWPKACAYVSTKFKQLKGVFQ